ncbi:MAG TPA: 3-methyl-2-oxobutanoate hydroxymethyltransferase [Candidatus Omnitrophota bacterium]|nr:3-methyl-2-oxobutanoate hydroxymethyltransferase [Candidatus Omnitrophota bacterium]
MNQRRTVQDILNKKKRGEKIAMLTAYDYPFASLIDQAGVDIVLVGDSLANVVLGLESTREVGMEVMLPHARAVNRAVKNAMVVGDMPFDSYQLRPNDALKNAKRFVEEAGCQAIKLEWFEKCLEVTEKIVRGGIPVMGHVGLTPQNVDQLGGFKVQGKEAQAAKKLIEHAKDLQRRGCFSIVLECIPDKIAQIITAELSIPTIGIGAGVHCDGQVLVVYDLLGLVSKHRPKFVKQYADLSPLIVQAVQQYAKEVREGKFPDEEHSFKMKEEEIEKVRSIL